VAILPSEGASYARIISVALSLVNFGSALHATYPSFDSD
jgi:hypothetical protein